MPYAPLLSEPEIIAGLRNLPEWRREGENLVRTVRCPSFRQAIDPLRQRPWVVAPQQLV